MDPESFSVDQILEAIDAEMENLKPKVLLFDIGGVCVSHPSKEIGSRVRSATPNSCIAFLILRKNLNIYISRSNHLSKSF